MKLPVKPKDVRDIIDDDDAFICFANTKEDRDKIIIAINGHEKLVLLKQGSIKFQCDKCHEWLTVTVQEIIGSDIKLEQDLKEAGKS